MIALFCLSAGFAAFPPSLCAQQKSIPEQIEWTWEVRPAHPHPVLPNVLLIGDSLTRNMFPEVTKELRGTANVYLFAASTSVGDPRLTRQIAEFVNMEDVRFRVVHFNNGMHGWKYTEAQFRAGFPAYLGEVETLVPSRRDLIWATITPVLPTGTGGATNARVDARNAIALSFVDAAGIRVDHQHALMLKHQDLHQDPVHFNNKGSDMEGDQAAAMIRQVLKN
ncbi:MAG: SGNH/GDSL hydrolase family protein [Acidobacteriaceae bacterium]